MRITIILLLWLAAFMAKSQYQSIAVEGRQWNAYYRGYFGLPSSMQYYRIGGDTLYNGDMLPTIRLVDSAGNHISSLLAFKEDTLAPAITFYELKENTLINGDSLFLNLAMSVGDTQNYACIEGDTAQYTLDSTVNFTDDIGQLRKMYWFTTLGGSFGSNGVSFSWVEGLGDAQRGIVNFIPVICVTDVPEPQLLCVTDSNGVKLYTNPSYDTCQFEIGMNEHRVSDMQFFPNPVQNEFYLEGEGLRNVELVRVLDLKGRAMKVWKNFGTENYVFPIPDITEGIYLMSIEFKGGNMQNFPFVIQK